MHEGKGDTRDGFSILPDDIQMMEMIVLVGKAGVHVGKTTRSTEVAKMDAFVEEYVIQFSLIIRKTVNSCSYFKKGSAQ